MTSARAAVGHARRWAAAALAMAVVVTGCSGSGPAAHPSITDPRSTRAAAPENYTGPVDGFYKVPKPLPAGNPGQLIRVQDLGDSGDLHTVRVMYHSRDALNHDRAVTGIISYPTAPAPAGGWPVTSQANGTVGLASQCALSRLGHAADGWGITGVHADTDYVGLGPIGEIHPYLSGPSEGNSVIDAVRAARNLPAAHASTKWFSIGHSQGGHGALFAGERARTYAPELHLMGTVALAPATELDKTYGPADEVVSRIVGAMSLYGAAQLYPNIHFADYAGPGLLAAQGVFRTGCLDQIITALAPIPAESFYAHDPRNTEPARSMYLATNQPGLLATPTPLFLAQGTADERVNVQRTKDFFARVCKLGQVTELLIVPGVNHGGIIAPAAPKAAQWMKDRLANKPPPNSCP